MDFTTQNLSDYIKRKGITLSKISKETGLPYSMLQPSLTGHRKLKVDEFLAICNFLHEDPFHFYGGS